MSTQGNHNAHHAGVRPVIGIIGGGQLGRMLGQAALSMGLRCRFLDESADAVAGDVGELIVDDFAAPKQLDVFCRGLVCATYEFENVPLALAHAIAARCPLLPGPRALEVCQDRLREKELFASLGIGTPPFAKVDSMAELTLAAAQIGLPAVLKTRRLGYDGKGQVVIQTAAELELAFATLYPPRRRAGRGGEKGGTGESAADLILEGFIAFDAELSILAARGISGELACYPVVENVHTGGILRLSRCPAYKRVDGAKHQLAAEAIAAKLIDALDYRGLLTVELFVRGGELLASEMAPRVHNSGHWTMNGARTSQFEQHLRAILDWPLGATATLGAAGMVNLIGAPANAPQLPEAAWLASLPGANVHWYGKAVRPMRKVGHLNFVERSSRELETMLAQTMRLLDVPGSARVNARGNGNGNTKESELANSDNLPIASERDG